MEKVSEWIACSGVEQGCLMKAVEVRQKSIKVNCVRFNSAGNSYKSYAFLPLSKCIQLLDDFYEDTKGETFFLVPWWLIYRKQDAEGIDLFG